jgi:hypothetical protein
VGILSWNQDIDIGYWKKLKGGLSKLFTLPAVKPNK